MARLLMSLRLASVILAWAACEGPADDPGTARVERFVRRTCKFGPLPQKLEDGYQRPDGSGAYIADVFGLPAAALARGGHVLSATARAGSVLSMTVQVPFATTALISVLLTDGGTSRNCRITWGVGGHKKQCVLSRVPLVGGPFTLSFRAVGLGESTSSNTDSITSPAACVLIRVDMEIGSAATSSTCEGSDVRLPPPLVGSEPRLDSSPLVAAQLAFTQDRYQAQSRENGAVWSSPLPSPEAESPTQMKIIFARLQFSLLRHSMQLLLEELDADAPIDKWPVCKYSCISGTPESRLGQVLQHGLPPGVHYRLWILVEEPQCVNFEFGVSIQALPALALQANYLGPPAWLCEGATWPTSLTQTAHLPNQVPGTAVGGAAALTGQSFDIRDFFELTRLPPLVDCSEESCFGMEAVGGAIGGLHLLELQVSKLSLLRLTTHASTVHVRPVLIRGDSKQAWAARNSATSVVPTQTIPMAGGEFRYAIHADLVPGTYTIAFVMGHAVGGLRPCSTVLLRLELAPIDSVLEMDSVQNGACPLDADIGRILDSQIGRVLEPLNNYVDRGQDAQLTFPRPSSMTLSNTELEVLGPSSVLSEKIFKLAPGEAPVLLRMQVLSPYLPADINVQLFCEGVPLAEPRISADGKGYVSVVGPLNLACEYKLVLFHTPMQRPPLICVTFSFDIAAVNMLGRGSATSMNMPVLAVSALPGNVRCRTVATELPSQIVVSPGKSATIDGEFLLPLSGQHQIQVLGLGSKPLKQGIVRIIVSSVDASVRVVDTLDAAPAFASLAEDRKILMDVSSIMIYASRLPTQAACPTLHLHVVASQSSEAPACPSAVNEISAQITKYMNRALITQPIDKGALRMFTAPIHATGLDLGVAFGVTAPTVEFRLEIALQPSWLPIEAVITNDDKDGRVSAHARATGHRLLLIVPGLPKGRYTLHLRSWTTEARNAAFDTFDSFQPHCATMTCSLALLEPAGRDTANYRQEMLTLPELIAVAPLPKSLTPQWLRSGEDFVRTQMYRLPLEGATTSISVTEPSVFRLLAEPANILTPRLQVEVRLEQDMVLAATEVIGSSVVRLTRAGKYVVRLTPGGGSACGGCIHQELPFLFTLGLVTMQTMKEREQESAGIPCPDAPDAITIGSPPPEANSAHLWQKRQMLRASDTINGIRVPLTVYLPAVVLFAAWSPYSARYVRVGLKTEEGLWVGEQRNYRSALEIELAPGEYTLMVAEPAPVWPQVPGCLVFGVSVTVSGISMPAAGHPVRQDVSPGMSIVSGGGGSIARALGLGSRCDALGASPLPLDIYSESGGSGSFGGPLDSNGRALIRHRMMLTDIHDGRKKVFLRPNPESVIRVAVVSGDASGLEVVIEDAAHKALAPTDVWSHGSNGWSMTVAFPQYIDGIWISIHREHRSALASGCAAFDLMLQLAPISDIVSMTTCPENAMSITDFVESVKGPHGFAEGWVKVLDVYGAFNDVLRFELPVPSLVEVEMQFNFLLSDVELILEGSSPPHLQISPELAAANHASAPLNTRTTLRLPLSAGATAVRILHKAAMSASSITRNNCIPLRLSLRHAPWKSGGATIMTSPDLSVPLAEGSDLVLAAVRPPNWVSTDVAVTVAGRVPSGMSEFGTSIVAIWDRDTLVDAARSQGRATDFDGQRLWALPLTFAAMLATKEEVLINLDVGKLRAGVPWSGQKRPLSTAPLQPLLTGEDVSLSRGIVPDSVDVKVLTGTGISSQEVHSSLRGPNSQQLASPASMHADNSVSAYSIKANQRRMPRLEDESGGSYIFHIAQVIGWIVLVVVVAYGGRHALLTGILSLAQDWTGWQLLPEREQRRRQREMHSVVEVTSQQGKSSISRGYGTVS